MQGEKNQRKLLPSQTSGFDLRVGSNHSWSFSFCFSSGRSLLFWRRAFVVLVVVTFFFRRKAFVAGYNLLHSISNLMVTIVVQIWDGDFVILYPWQGLCGERSTIVGGDSYRGVFAENCKIINGWCGLSFVGLFLEKKLYNKEIL